MHLNSHKMNTHKLINIGKNYIYVHNHTILHSSVHSRGETVDHVSVFEDDQVQPATAALPSGGDPYLMTPGLK